MDIICLHYTKTHYYSPVNPEKFQSDFLISSMYYMIRNEPCCHQKNITQKQNLYYKISIYLRKPFPLLHHFSYIQRIPVII